MSKIERELDNYFLTIHDLASGAERWESRAGWLEFAPNNVCNLRCLMCEQSDGLALSTMSIDDTTRLLDEVLPTTSLWTPSALSEPMLANIKLVLKKCREHDVHLNFNTNCTTLTGERFAAICDRIQKLWISFDTSHQQTFEMLRAPADFEQVAQNIRDILPIAAERNIPVGFVSVLFRDNLEQLPDLVDFLADHGAVEARSDLRVQPLLDNSQFCIDYNVHTAYSDAEICEWFDRACERAQERGLIFHVDMDEPFRRSVAPHAAALRGIVPDLFIKMIDTVKQRYPRVCYMAATYMKIEPDGKVFPCCRGPRELEMGNIHESSVEEIWNGEPYRALRRRMMAGDYPEVCQTCDHLVANPHFDKSLLPAPDRAAK